MAIGGLQRFAVPTDPKPQPEGECKRRTGRSRDAASMPLAGLRSQEPAAGLDRAAVIAQTVIELDDPTPTEQKRKNTCGPAVA